MIRVGLKSLAVLLLLSFAVVGARPSTLYESKKPADGDESPTRSVKDQVLSSAEKPVVSLKFAKEFKYVGAQTFILYDVVEHRTGAHDRSQIAALSSSI